MAEAAGGQGKIQFSLQKTPEGGRLGLASWTDGLRCSLFLYFGGLCRFFDWLDSGYVYYGVGDYGASFLYSLLFSPNAALFTCLGNFIVAGAGRKSKNPSGFGGDGGIAFKRGSGVRGVCESAVSLKVFWNVF